MTIKLSVPASVRIDLINKLNKEIEDAEGARSYYLVKIQEEDDNINRLKGMRAAMMAAQEIVT